jgi:hypothetical protein
MKNDTMKEVLFGMKEKDKQSHSENYREDAENCQFLLFVSRVCHGFVSDDFPIA